MDTALCVASKRDVRRYAPDPVPAGVSEAILDAGRLAGSARNRQPWRFVVPSSRELRARVAETVYVPATVRDAPLVVVVTVTPGGGLVDMDAGRAAQNMMLVAWACGVASCPNGVADPAALAALLGLAEDEGAPIVLSFGYPERPRDPARRPAEEWSRRARRLPLEELVRRPAEPAG